MIVRILIDMNLSPNWVPLLQRHGWAAVHWSTIGDPCAPDAEVMAWAATHQYVVFTHDLARFTDGLHTGRWPCRRRPFLAFAGASGL
jgi:predicted nuclease of predicted toxin-antitoxin system